LTEAVEDVPEVVVVDVVDVLLVEVVAVVLPEESEPPPHATNKAASPNRAINLAELWIWFLICIIRHFSESSAIDAKTLICWLCGSIVDALATGHGSVG
jgi:hypothetical protein